MGRRILVILLGGRGERLWPLSTQGMPKQFLKIFSEESLFQKTLERHLGLFDQIFLLTHEEYFFTVCDQMKETRGVSLFLEPVGKGTLPSLLVSLLQLERDDLVFMTPSDLWIEEEKTYQKAVESALEVACKKKICLIGVPPLFPHTGLGYIQEKNGEVIQFIEKPDCERAALLAQQSDIYWNSGLLCFEVGTFLSQVEGVQPQLFQQCTQIHERRINFPTLVPCYRFIKSLMEEVPSLSIDRGILEHAVFLQVVIGQFGWRDLGSFKMLEEVLEKKNAVSIKNAKNSFVFGMTKNVHIEGIDDLAVIEHHDAVYITRRLS